MFPSWSQVTCPTWFLSHSYQVYQKIGVCPSDDFLLTIPFFRVGSHHHHLPHHYPSDNRSETIPSLFRTDPIPYFRLLVYVDVFGDLHNATPCPFTQPGAEVKRSLSVNRVVYNSVLTAGDS